ncbi:MAG TPA: alpha/beta hydrolase [Kofleriaceae bacterium]|nr:alpha/beta hydrolase [Kofleriaceae bacterium]
MRSMLTRASAALDRGVVRWMERRMAPTAPRIDPSSHARENLLEIAAGYNAAGERFFPAPELPDVTLSPLGDGPLGTQVVDLAFASEYQPFLPAARDAYLAVRENFTAHARWWTSDRGRPCIVMLHGWGGGNHWVTERTFAVPYWLRHGYDVISFQLPYHGARAPRVKGVGNLVQSGALFPSPNPLRTNEAFGHAIYDLRALAMVVRARGSSAVGAIGMSLGGYTTALWATIGPGPAALAMPGGAGNLDFAVAMIPAVSMARLMWRHGETSPARKRAMNAGIDEDLLADAFAIHSPARRPVALPRERLFVIAGRGDQITPSDHAEELAKHWNVDIKWFEGGHLAQVGSREALRDVRRELGALDFPGRVFRS